MTPENPINEAASGADQGSTSVLESDARPRGSALLTSDSGGTGETEPKTNPVGLLILVGLMGWLWVAAGFRMFLFVVALIVMIFLHELGHFMTARWTGMKATEFFIGMGPRLWSFKRGETEYGIRAIPAGAFVRIIGMNNLDPVSPEDEPRAYKNATFPRRLLVITAGSIMHFIQAIIVLTIAFSLVGTPDRESPWTIAELSALDNGEPAPSMQAGLEPGDRLVSVDGQQDLRFDELAQYLQPIPGQEVALTVERDGERFDTVVTLAENRFSDGEVRGFLGVSPAFDGRVTEGPLEGVQVFGEVAKVSITTIPQFFQPSRLANLGSLIFEGREDVDITSEEAQERPISMVGAVRIAGEAQADWFEPLFFFAVINIFVGLINLAPLLPLDGGHAVIAIYERIRSRNGKRYQMDVAKLLPLTYAVVALLGFIFITTITLDILRPIS